MMGPLCKPYIDPYVVRTNKGRLRVAYVGTTLGHVLSRAEAETYLAWLDAGNVGTHFGMVKASEITPAASPPCENKSNVGLCECVFCGATTQCAKQNGEGICQRCAEWAIGQLQGEVAR
jgi:hypothetical protein